MCIRDSAKTNGLVDEMGGLERAIALVKQKAKIAESEQVQPVSYTHLRAHETVLDLVCRLLLEKKKD